jgi:hypothetical protein
MITQPDERPAPLVDLDHLEATLRDRDVTDVEIAAVEQRHLAFSLLGDSAPRREWPPRGDDVVEMVSGLPEVPAFDLSTSLVASAISNHGCVLVRGLLDHGRCHQLVEDIDRSIAARDAWLASQTSPERDPWFQPFKPSPDYEDVANVRNWVAKGGGTWLADSPRAFSHFVAALRATGLSELVADYLGERPVLSVKKSTLRRVPPTLEGADWHQDGAFMDRGTGIRTLNVWIALTDCGTDAPGLEIIPRRLDSVLPTGGDGAYFDWSVGPGTIDEHCDSPPRVKPQFNAGDALLFDQYLVHRTSVEPGMTRDRYATETWFFAPSTYPRHLVPLVL